MLEARTAGKFLAAIEDRDVVEPEETAFEDVVALAVDLVHPPREIQHQLVEALLEKIAIGAVADAIHVVDAPDRPRMDRRIEIREFPLICRDLSVGVLELLEQHQPQLFLREMRVDQRQHDCVKREVPCREPRVLPLVGHRQDAF